MCEQRTITAVLHKSSAQTFQLEEEAVLDPGIQFRNPLALHACTPRAVFLTGATGLLGAYLLEALLQRTQAVVYCLVRTPDSTSGKQRLVRHLESYGLWQAKFDARVVPIPGDVALPCFGLSRSQFDCLADQTDTIYHSAGSTSLLQPYARLRPTNVLGVLEALRLAGHVHTKPFHFISSMVVFFSPAHPPDVVLKETDAPGYHPEIKGGYAQTKWVADRLVSCAQARGLPACIFRPTRIMGHSRSGALNDATDLLPQLLKACLTMEQYPPWDIDITWVPVDYVSQSIVHVATNTQSWGRAFHFVNPAPLPWKTLIAILRESGYPLEEVPEKQWRENLRYRATQDGARPEDKECLVALLVVLAGRRYLFYKRPPFDTRNIREGLAGAHIACPPIDRTLVSTYVAYWQQSGFLPMPRSKQTEAS